MLDVKQLASLPATLEGVIFDMDGLLLDTETYYKVAIFDACNALGSEMTDDIHSSLIGTPKELGDEKLRAAFGPAFDIAKYHEICHARFAAQIAHNVPRKHGVSDILGWLFEHRIPIGIATSSKRDLAISNLTRAGIYKYVEVLVSLSDVEHGKPHPESYLSAVSSMGVDFRNCLAFEDSYNGIRSAAAAGIPTIMIPDMLPATDEMHGKTVMILDTLADALEILTGQYNNR
jgi:beta-phosphoglucomutase-like phosphatase (HAD superfamily)